MDNHVVGGEALRHGAADADVTSRRAHPRGACSLQRGQRFSSRAHRCFLLRVSFPAGEVLRSASQRTIPYKDSCTWGPQITVAFKLSQPGPLQRSVGWRAFPSSAAPLPITGVVRFAPHYTARLRDAYAWGTTDYCGLGAPPPGPDYGTLVESFPPVDYDRYKNPLLDWRRGCLAAPRGSSRTPL